MSIVESDGTPSWSLDASETGESTKCPCVGVVEGTEAKKIIRFLLFTFVLRVFFAEDFGIRIDEILVLETS